MASYNFVLAAAAAIALAILACPSSCRADMVDLIGEVCAQMEHPHFCSTTLNSDPRSNLLETYPLLAKISIDKAKTQSTVVASVARRVGTDENRNATEGCVAALNLSTRSLEQAKRLLKVVHDNKTQTTLDMKVLEAWAYSVGCDMGFANVPQPPVLKLNNGLFLDLIEVIRFVVSRLV